MKKLVSFVLVMLLTISLAGCGSTKEKSASNIKVGFIFIGDENEGYTAAHYNGAKEMQKALGLKDNQLIVKWTIKEDEGAYDAAVDLVDQGCNIIFANSFGHEPYMIQAAKEFPDVQFCHATGAGAASSGCKNMHNYFTNVYESRYVSGVVAGLKLNEMIEQGKITPEEAVMGYVGAYPYAEVISGFTSFYLGAKSVCPTVTMKVTYTNSWADMSLEQEAANSLIANKCVLISQHADTTGAPTACEAAGVPCVGYNVDMIPVASNTALTSASINWAPYYTYAVQCVLDKKDIDVDWCQGYKEGADKITELNKNAIAEGTEAKVAEVEAAIKDGSLKVFDTSTFTIGGSSLEDLVASDPDNYGAAKDLISGGYYHESEQKSAPSFGFIIDGITAVE